MRTALAFGAIGFADDYLKVVRRHNRGLSAMVKLAAQVVVGAVFGWVLLSVAFEPTLTFPFFKDLVDFMTSGPVVVQVLEGEGAIAKNRELMGATNPKEADAGTIRADFASSIDANAVHGSDSPESAEREVSYFFGADEICPR